MVGYATLKNYNEFLMKTYLMWKNGNRAANIVNMFSLKWNVHCITVSDRRNNYGSPYKIKTNTLAFGKDGNDFTLQELR